ncbi:MAG TPA: C39 family peptidase, partial [Patescibacteria group bacterium]|nr:C39 family peptidase [Patescibacteria group bacterium]
IPQRVLIKVPFSPQAPFAQWDQFHEEACEEASLVMIRYFLIGKSLNKDIAEDEIQKMIKFEIQKYDNYVDSDAQQIVTLAKDFYGINNLKVIYDFKKDDLKKYLARGKPIIIPAAGQLLGNPNFKYPGPPYHALVMIGYDGNTIITNDPGTRKGEGYRYNIDVLYNAIHDFPGNRDKIVEGRKAMIIIE